MHSFVKSYTYTIAAGMNKNACEWIQYGLSKCPHPGWLNNVQINGCILFEIILFPIIFL